ncbi:CBASS cGAMP synthase [Roseateles chitinivorans]|uniref:CBASS cGAMP synthase n=1 Tax=Roseateles chitinivorans TaxID=2917965 RepID=UPI003D67EF31
MLKFSKLLYQHGANKETFANAIRPNNDQTEQLKGAIKKIRDHVRPHLAQATVAKLGMDRPVTPRFRTQGSWSYDTCIVPAKMPPQEMDWDFGIYLPVTVWEDNGPPHRMAKAYFDLVEEILADLCRKERWNLLTGKDTCIRIEIAKWAHIDLPLYAAPEDEFKRIVESVQRSAVVNTLDSIGLEGWDAIGELMQRQSWADLDTIVMATRKGEWMRSDPQAVANWFKDRIEDHGQQLRRVCRYLKAWRDYHWISGGPTSVSLMIAAAQGYQFKAERDDLALEESARRLSSTFLTDIRERGIDNGAEDFNRLSASDRVTASHQFAQLADEIARARNASLNERGHVITQLRGKLGMRIPYALDAIELESSADVVRNTPPDRVVAPAVPSTKAG